MSDGVHCCCQHVLLRLNTGDGAATHIATPRARTAAQLRLQEKRLINATTTAVRRRLAPIRGIPTKQGMEDPNADLIEIFDAIENLPNKPKQMFDDFRKWARGDYEDQIRSGGKGGGGSGCG